MEQPLDVVVLNGVEFHGNWVHLLDNANVSDFVESLPAGKCGLLLNNVTVWDFAKFGIDRSTDMSLPLFTRGFCSRSFRGTKLFVTTDRNTVLDGLVLVIHSFKEE
jgi:hypothetical protein